MPPFLALLWSFRSAIGIGLLALTVVGFVMMFNHYKHKSEEQATQIKELTQQIDITKKQILDIQNAEAEARTERDSVETVHREVTTRVIQRKAATIEKLGKAKTTEEKSIVLNDAWDDRMLCASKATETYGSIPVECVK